MVIFNKYAYVLLSLGSGASAFTPVSNIISASQKVSLVQRMVATTPADLGIKNSGPSFNSDENDDDERSSTGAMIDLTGIAFSVSTSSKIRK